MKENGIGNTYSYDPMGRLAVEHYALPSTGTFTLSASAQYDPAGNMTDLTYPSGRHIKQGFDGAGHLTTSSLVDLGGVSATAGYLQSMTYLPDGSPQEVTLGNGVVQTIAKNNRLQVQSMVGSSPLEPFNGQPFISRTYCYSNCPTGGTADNGNIWGITDNLISSRSQGFTYDSLNRLRSFAFGGLANQAYSIDSFGNMTQMVGPNPVSIFDPATNRINNLPCAASVPAYDAAGNQLCDTDQYGGVSQRTFDAESRISQIAALNSGASPFVTYTYGGEGDRVRKGNADGTFTEYVSFGGQPIAEKDQLGAWTDYIYANGQKIARVAPTVTALQMSGQHGVGGCDSTYIQRGLGGYQYLIRTGDKLFFDENNSGARGGLVLIPFDAGTTYFMSGNTGGSWQHQSFDLSSLAGETINGFWPIMTAPSGAWTAALANISLVSTDGAVTPIYWGQSLAINTIDNCGAPASTFAQGPIPVDSSGPQLSTTYMLGDHLGTAQMEFSAGGWPLWQGQFAPFGQELATEAPYGTPAGPASVAGASLAVGHYKFTGKERDAESGLDYFGARMYASTMGRWMSPDPSNLGADIYMPQTLNKYNYAVNNPLTIKDANGLWPFYIHNEIIGESFPGMSKQDLQGLKDASWNMDFGKGQQNPSMSYEHGMSDGTTNQDPMAAQQMGDNFISQQVQTAQQAQADWEAQGHTGIAPTALQAFGNALHTATDRTSPSHRGNQPWHNDPWYNKRTRDHVAGEATINASDRRAADNAARQLFQRTFGNQFMWMLQKEPCFSTSASDNHGNSTGSSGCQ